MFNFQGSELIIILLLALVVLGPEKLPEAMRRLGRFYADLKKMSTGFQEEFRAAVDEPVRELRDTANTIRDSVDFRKLADGERDEKPKSAEMAPADPDATPTDDVPFRTSGSGEPSGAPDPSAPPDGSGDPTDVDSDDGSADAGAADPPERPPVPAPPAPFSSSQSISAAPRPPSPPPDGDRPRAEPPVAPQVAVDDEDGLRESRPAEPGTADPRPRAVPAQVAVDDEHGLREARPADAGSVGDDAAPGSRPGDVREDGAA